MDDALRVDDDLDGVVVDIVQPVCLDDLQPLVGERRRVDRDLGAHRPGRVTQGLRRRHGLELGRRRVEERAAGRGQDQRGDPGHGLPDERLPDGRMLRVDRAQPGQRARVRVTGTRDRDALGQRPRQRHHQMTAGDQGLLVGRGDDLAGAQGGEHRPEAHDAARSDDHEVDVVPRGELDEGVRSADPFRAGRQVQAGHVIGVGEGDRGRPQAVRLLCEERGVGAGGEGDDPERIRERGQDVDRLASDRAGRADEGDPLRRALPSPARISGGRRRHTASGPAPRTRMSRPGRGSHHDRG